MQHQYAQSLLFTEPGGFTEGIEGPVCDAAGNLYAVNFARQGTIGKVTPDGTAQIFLSLPNGSVGSGIRFSRAGDMFIADAVKHNILAVDMQTRGVRIYAHDERLNQPNDLAIAADDTLYASDPCWRDSTGQLWRVGSNQRFELLEAHMGTTNGIEVDCTRHILYVNETVQRHIWAYDIGAGGMICNKRLLITFEDYLLDGMRCDIAGNVYVTRYGKGVIAKISPAGELLAEIALHGADCSNITFGGPDGCTCYVTLADQGNIECFRSDLPGQSWHLWQQKGA
jgi:gluconolactonase